MNSNDEDSSAISSPQVVVFLQEANKRSQLGPVASKTALKFLRARKFDNQKALQLFEAHQSTRVRDSLIDVSPFEVDVCRELLSCKVTVLLPDSTDGSSIVLLSVRLFKPPIIHGAFLRSFVYQLDILTERDDVQKNGIIIIADMTDASYANVDLSLALKIYNIANGAYPARVRTILIFAAPLWFRIAVVGLSGMFRQKMAQRIVFVSTPSELVSKITQCGGGNSRIEALPRHLGGLTRLDHRQWFEHCLLSHPDSCTADVPKTLRLAATGLDGVSSSPTTHIPNLMSRNSIAVMHMSSASPNLTTSNGSPVPSGSILSRRDSGILARRTVGKAPLERHGSLNIKGLTISIVAAAQQGGPQRIDTDDSDYEDASPAPNKGQTSHQPGTVSRIRPEVATLGAITLTTTNPPSSLNIEPRFVLTGATMGTGDSSGRSSPSSATMTPNQLVEHFIRLGAHGLRREYAGLKAQMVDPRECSASRLPENRTKNRYSDVPCLDATRVRLNPRIDGDTNDYIHANFVSLPDIPGAFICSQGPLDETIPDFWSMIWQYSVPLIIMTTRLVERNRAKCAAYWPNASGAQLICHPFIISNLSVDVSNKHWTTSKLSVVNAETGEERIVFHFFYHSWPDFGIPDVGAFADFLSLIDAYSTLSLGISSVQRMASASPDLLAGLVMPGAFLSPLQEQPPPPTSAVPAKQPCFDFGSPGASTSGGGSSSTADLPTCRGPILVHCSAGIGRTGTLCAIAHSLRQLQLSSAVPPRCDLMTAVRTVRSERAMSIQSIEQFSFVWLAVTEVARRQGLVSVNRQTASLLANIVDQLQQAPG